MANFWKYWKCLWYLIGLYGLVHMAVSALSISDLSRASDDEALSVIIGAVITVVSAFISR